MHSRSTCWYTNVRIKIIMKIDVFIKKVSIMTRSFFLINQTIMTCQACYIFTWEHTSECLNTILRNLFIYKHLLKTLLLKSAGFLVLLVTAKRVILNFWKFCESKTEDGIWNGLWQCIKILLIILRKWSSFMWRHILRKSLLLK